MIIKDGQKYACAQCIRGHRASNCSHEDRPLKAVRGKGRPPTQCDKCRELRRIRKVHVKCVCAEVAAAPAAAPAADQCPPPKARRLSPPASPPRKAGSIQSLLNPCSCSGGGFCTCCESGFRRHLTSRYPARIVEQEARALSESMRHHRPESMRHHHPESVRHHHPESLRHHNHHPGPGPHHSHHPGPGSHHNYHHPGPSPHHFRPPPAPAAAATWPGSRPSFPTMAAPPPRPRQPGSDPRELMERPHCNCGCECNALLDMLTSAIEARIGRDGLDDLVSAVRAPSDRLAGMTPQAPPPPLPRPLQTGIGSAASLRATMPHVTATTSAPHSASGPTFRSDPALAPFSGRNRSSSESSAGSAVSAVRFLGSPASRTSSREVDGSVSARGFASGVMPPVSRPACDPSVPAACSGPERALPQQVLPAKSCCGPAASTTNNNTNTSNTSNTNGGCCSSKSAGGGCACCKRGGWRPATAANAEVDADGALACGCGCHKPFGECGDCIRDGCESLLFNASV
ncbi:copper-binding transcription factor [Coemansia javaensis]|uniref:Copper-binding transcription factor n=1 Tax=Coemansia javaensis TaxID=2761396 RepID=A0A9W8HG30_9FUNG|nr:copper-binding transcription factor [Coemansia javaensis]